MRGAVQAVMAERNEAVAQDRRMLFRIGINLGDVLIEGDDILGDGVNIAARLEGIAEPGGICISEDAYRQVRGKVAVEFADLGEQNLKNIARPVRAYAIESISGPSRRKQGPMADMDTGFRRYDAEAQRAPPRLSIVVLPFANLGGDPEQEYFVDGVTESLTTDLSRMAGSFVIGRNTAFSYKGKNVDLKQLGRELGVRYVLEGSVQRGGNRLRVNVQLVDAGSSNHLWAERFDKPLADLFDMQDEIVARLASQLGAELIAAEARRAEKSPTPDSMDLYFQGHACANRGLTPADSAETRSFFERALMLDPLNVEALVGLAAVDANVGGGLFTTDRAARLAAAEVALTKALSLAPKNALAHQTMGHVQIFTNRAAQGIAELERALSLDRNLASAHGLIGLAKFTLGRSEETEAHIEEALRLSPLDVNAFLWISFAGFAKLYIGRNEDAVSRLRRAIDTNRNYPIAHFWLAAALAQLGRLDEARAEARAGLALDPSFTVRRVRAGAMSDNPTYLAQRERIYDGMRKAGVPER
jgi:TolB-like protein